MQVLEGPLDEVEVKGWAFSGENTPAVKTCACCQTLRL